MLEFVLGLLLKTRPQNLIGQAAIRSHAHNAISRSIVSYNGMWPASRGPSRTARVHVYSNPTPMYTHNMSSVKTMRAVLAKGSRDNWPNLPREASITVLDHIRSRLTAKNASTSATHLCHSRGLPPWPPRTQPDMLTYQTTCT
jgi:hypothetical protein